MGFIPYRPFFIFYALGRVAVAPAITMMKIN
jgi:hypothetical protein